MEYYILINRIPLVHQSERITKIFYKLAKQYANCFLAQRVKKKIVGEINISMHLLAYS